MESEREGSITRCVLDLRNGDAAAATLLWERYFAILVQVAKKRLARSGSTVRGRRRGGRCPERICEFLHCRRGGTVPGFV